MSLIEWLFGGNLAARVDELEDQVDSLRMTNRRLTTSLELQATLIRSLRDVNADLDRRLLEVTQ